VGYDQNPRKQFEAALDYAVKLSAIYLRTWRDAGLELNNARLLEIGPGADFAPHLVLASVGTKVTLSDKYLAVWDEDFHPAFYAEFLEKWDGPSEAIRQAIKQNGYGGILETIKQPAEKMKSIKSATFDMVQSIAVLEHVSDFKKVARELARVTKPGALHTHQIDFRDHRTFDRPLEYLRLDQKSYADLRGKDGGNHGTSKRLPEFLDAFSRYFWIWKFEVNAKADDLYVSEVFNDLPSDSPYKTWPKVMLKDVGARVWLLRKSNKVSFF
jgi:SAM-dependent methyltransferase